MAQGIYKWEFVLKKYLQSFVEVTLRLVCDVYAALMAPLAALLFFSMNGYMHLSEPTKR